MYCIFFRAIDPGLLLTALLCRLATAVVTYAERHLVAALHMSQFEEMINVLVCPRL